MTSKGRFIVLMVGLSGRVAVAVALLGLALSIPAWAEKGGKGGGGGGSSAPLQATFRDAGFNNLTIAPDRIGSDCRLGDLDPASCPYVSGPGSVTMGFSGNGNFQLEVRKETRDIYLNFTDCVASPCSPSFLPSGEVEALVGTERGFRAKLDVFGLGNLPVDGSAMLNADLLFARLVDLDDGEEEVWWVTFRSAPPAVCPAGSSGPVLAERTGANTWVITAGSTNIGCLHSMAPRPNGDGSEEFHGAYIMPFRLTITTQ